jgi:GNAT superfamily N-acetyltransferase
MNHDILIREAQKDDLPFVLDLYAQPDMDKGQVLSVQKAQEIFELFSHYPNYRLFVAVTKNQPEVILGTFALLIMNNLAHMGSSSAIVEDVLVSNNHQGQGIGQMMMLHAMELARKAQCYKLVLSSNHKRQKAHYFYRKLGFSEHGLSFHVDLI